MKKLFYISYIINVNKHMARDFLESTIDSTKINYNNDIVELNKYDIIKLFNSNCAVDYLSQEFISYVRDNFSEKELQEEIKIKRINELIHFEDLVTHAVEEKNKIMLKEKNNKDLENSFLYLNLLSDNYYCRLEGIRSLLRPANSLINNILCQDYLSSKERMIILKEIEKIMDEYGYSLSNGESLFDQTKVFEKGIISYCDCYSLNNSGISYSNNYQLYNDFISNEIEEKIYRNIISPNYNNIYYTPLTENTNSKYRGFIPSAFFSNDFEAINYFFVNIFPNIETKSFEIKGDLFYLFDGYTKEFYGKSEDVFFDKYVSRLMDFFKIYNFDIEQLSNSYIMYYKPYIKPIIRNRYGDKYGGVEFFNNLNQELTSINSKKNKNIIKENNIQIEEYLLVFNNIIKKDSSDENLLQLLIILTRLNNVFTNNIDLQNEKIESVIALINKYGIDFLTSYNKYHELDIAINEFVSSIICFVLDKGDCHKLGKNTTSDIINMNKEKYINIIGNNFHIVNYYNNVFFSGLFPEIYLSKNITGLKIIYKILNDALNYYISNNYDISSGLITVKLIIQIDNFLTRYRYYDAEEFIKIKDALYSNFKK